MTDRAPVEGKVWAATVGGGAGTTAVTFVVWLLGVLAWHASSAATAAADAVAAVPLPVVGMVYLVVGVGGIFIGGYLAKHTPRPLPEVDEANVEVTEASASRAVNPLDPDGDGRDDRGRFVAQP